MERLTALARRIYTPEAFGQAGRGRRNIPKNPVCLIVSSLVAGEIHVVPLLDWAMPSKYHSVHKNDLARAMVAQSEQAFLAIAQATLRRGRP
jgi:hypothetical protein